MAPPSVTVVAPLDSIMFTPGVSLSVIVAVTVPMLIALKLESDEETVWLMVATCVPSVIGSSIAVTTIVCGVFHDEEVKVTDAGEKETCVDATGGR